MTGNAPTNGNSAKRSRTESNKQRSVLLGQKRVRKERTKTRGGDSPAQRNKGRGNP